jgi:hypothetical protein
MSRGGVYSLTDNLKRRIHSVKADALGAAIAERPAGPKRERRIYRLLRWYFIPAAALAGLVGLVIHYL